MASDQGGGNWAYLKIGAAGLLIDGANINVQGNPAILDFSPDEIFIPTLVDVPVAITPRFLNVT